MKRHTSGDVKLKAIEGRLVLIYLNFFMFLF